MTDTRNIAQELEPLPMRRHHLLQNDNSRYRVVTMTGEVKHVEAGTAYEAFRQAGVRQAMKIERMSNIRHIVLTKQQIARDELPPAGNASDSLADIVDAEAEQFEQIRKFHNPVISADDLDRIMHGFKLDEKPIIVSEATGVEVHNDGFDEIIPSPAPEKPQPQAKKEPPRVEAKAEIPLPPPTKEELQGADRSLTQAEVDKLLNG